MVVTNSGRKMQNEPCFFCREDVVPDETHQPFAHIESRHGEDTTKSYMSCAKCRPNIMSLFNSNRLRDGRRLPLSIAEADIRTVSCIHCGIHCPAESIKCQSSLFRTPYEVCVLCKKCVDGVYTQLAILQQKHLFQKVEDTHALENGTQ